MTRGRTGFGGAMNGDVSPRVCFRRLLEQIATNLVAEKNTNLLSDSSGGQNLRSVLEG